MGREIERKFLTASDAWRAQSRERRAIRQGYLLAERERSVRVRIADADAWLTIKGESRGATREEYEYAIPTGDAEAMLEGLCRRPLVEKTRHRVEHAGHTWEVDEFHGENAGLVVAEVELASEDEEPARPEWLGEEVTGDPRYLNANLARRPWRTWGGRSGDGDAVGERA